MPSFASKYRPTSFEALVGQPLVTRMLSGCIRYEKRTHILLFGASGNGKTSAGRLYARALNCEAITSRFSPCNSCEACLSALSGAYPDFIEFNGGSLGQKDQVVRLIEVANSPPMYGKCRVVLVEEAQGLSKAAWDALLKVMEEPPPALVFIFTTTAREKISAAVASRCAPLMVKPVSVQDTVKHLRRICVAERLDFQEDALTLIAFSTKGNLRESIQKLEDVSILGEVSASNVCDLLGLGYIEHITRLWLALVGGDLVKALEAAADWPDEASSVLERCKEFLLFLQCRFLHRSSMIVNPVFEALPTASMREIADSVESLGKSAGMTVEQTYASIAKVLGAYVTCSDLALQLVVRDVHALLHLKNFDPSKPSRVVSSAGSPAQPRRSGRLFVPSYIEGEPGIAYPATVPAPAETAFAPASTLDTNFVVSVPTFAGPPEADVSAYDGHAGEPLYGQSHTG